MKPSLLFAALLLTSQCFAQEEQRPDGYAPLENLVGRWSIAGKEGTYLEICDWYDGRRHIICNTEAKREDGSTARGMSILSFVPGQGYVYTGIGNQGRYETYRDGTYKDGLIEYLDHRAGVHTRIRLGPFDDERVVPFRVHTSRDGTTWELAASFTYVRVK
jgi:hypothetical protein